MLAKAEQEVFAIAEAGSRNVDFTPVRKALLEAFDVLQTRAEQGGGVTGLPTSYTEFDEMTAGLQPTDLVILAARPVDGQDHAGDQHRRIRRAEVEEGGGGVLDGDVGQPAALRMISSVRRVNATRLRTGALEDEDWSQVSSAIQLMRDVKVFIDDTPALSPDVLRAKRAAWARARSRLIVIDYLQLMQVPGNSENRATEISEISRSLKALAKELNVPVIALSQLNRSLETTHRQAPGDGRPARESGAIEQDADMIVFIYRDEYYQQENSPDKGPGRDHHRQAANGPTGSFKLKFFGEYTRFDNLAHDSVSSFEQANLPGRHRAAAAGSNMRMSGSVTSVRSRIVVDLSRGRRQPAGDPRPCRRAGDGHRQGECLRPRAGAGGAPPGGLRRRPPRRRLRGGRIACAAPASACRSWCWAGSSARRSPITSDTTWNHRFLAGQAAPGRGGGRGMGQRARVHLKIDTGMERIGVHSYSVRGVHRGGGSLHAGATSSACIRTSPAPTTRRRR